MLVGIDVTAMDTLTLVGEDILVILTAPLYVNNDIYVDEEPSSALFVSSDTRTQLATPDIKIDHKTGIAMWNEVEHAIDYRVSHYGYSVSGNYYSEYVSSAGRYPYFAKRKKAHG